MYSNVARCSLVGVHWYRERTADMCLALLQSPRSDAKRCLYWKSMQQCIWFLLCDDGPVPFDRDCQNTIRRNSCECCPGDQQLSPVLKYPPLRQHFICIPVQPRIDIAPSQCSSNCVAESTPGAVMSVPRTTHDFHDIGHRSPPGQHPTAH